MAKNVGKIFESDYQDSVPKEWLLLYRLKDSATAFSNGNAVRFSIKNPCDYFMFDSRRGIFYALELKSVGGKSISFAKKKDDKAIIHYHQIKGLTEFGQYPRTVSGFVFNFRCINKTCFMSIDVFNTMIAEVGKKSFNLSDLENYKYIEIDSELKKVHYKYDIEKFVDEATLLVTGGKDVLMGDTENNGELQLFSPV